jgi:hypothetical protein
MLRRTIISTGVVSALLVIGAGTAFADPWGGVDCTQTWYTGCRLGAGQGGQQGPAQPGQGGSPASGNQHGGDGAQSGSQAPPGDQVVGGTSQLANCSYVRSDYQPPATGSITAAYRRPSDDGEITAVLSAYRSVASSVNPRSSAVPTPGQPGAWYVYQCSGPGVTDGLYHPPVWIPAGQNPVAPPAPSPQQVAQQAYNQLRLPSPEIRLNPGGTQLVNLPTWMWVADGAWGSKSATAAVPGVSVTATAVPDRVVWQMGDGATVTCAGPGSAFPVTANPLAASPDCGHTYTRSSLGEPNNEFNVSATVHWTVTWTGAGQGGTFPDLTTTSTAAFAVVESQALNRN